MSQAIPVTVASPDVRPALGTRLAYPWGFARGMRDLLASEWRARPWPKGVSPWRTWREGFTTWAWRMYGLDRRNPDDYLGDLAQKLWSRRVNGPAALVLEDKAAMTRVLERCAAPQPTPYAIVRRGVVRLWDGRVIADATRWLDEMLERHGALVIKPIRGSMGCGVTFLRRQGQVVTMNDQATPAPQVRVWFGRLKGHLVTECVEQCGVLRSLHAQTVNTVRLTTLAHAGEVLVAGAALRIGTRRSFPVDNFMAGWGGLSAPIDPRTGELGAGCSVSPIGDVTRHAQHPDTSDAIAGVGLPGWDQVVRLVVALAGALPRLPYLAWDVALTEQGPSVIEVNAQPGLYVVQVHTPLLADPRVRRAFTDWGVIR